MAGKVKEFLKVAGAEKMIEWDKHFGMGLYGAFLSVGAGILILVFPNFIAYIVGFYLILRGILELLRYGKRKTLNALGR